MWQKNERARSESFFFLTDESGVSDDAWLRAPHGGLKRIEIKGLVEDREGVQFPSLFLHTERGRRSAQDHDDRQVAVEHANLGDEVDHGATREPSVGDDDIK